ncbi:hypothetical protein [Streptosporangium sp. NPDC051022]|uniref:hypothetical protein n=1 Tax=Streptosporangium sp. NPDC051022 TaxID=3155752 RepID=UPI003444A437
MRRTITLLAPVTAAAILLTGAIAGPATADSTVTLNLYTEHHQIGDVQEVPVPADESCVELETTIGSLSAHNESETLTAELYSNSSCTGTPVEVVDPQGKVDFSHRHKVGSVQFIRN